MRKIIASVSILALSAGAASADKFAEPVVEPEIEAAPAEARDFTPVFNWTGAYAGLGVGMTNTRDRVSLNPTFDVDGSGAGVFGFAGYNFQLDNNVVLGVEGDLGYNRVTGTGSEPFNGAGRDVESRLRTSGSLRGRAGYALDRTLIYGTAGVAMGRYTATVDNGFNEFSETRTGWTIGAGVEQALEGGWTIRGEYRFTDFGSSTLGAGGMSGSPGNGSDLNGGISTLDVPQPTQLNTRLRTHEVRVGAAFRF